MATLHLIDLEAVPTRYTGEWKDHVPELLRQANLDVVVYEGPTDIPQATTPGAFLNFGGTNIYKSSQMEQFSRAFTEGKVHAGDHVMFTDAWNPGILQVKYMSELLGIPVTTHGLWHAGSYDPADFLGRLVGNKPWVRHTEQAMFYAFDHNHFATDFHIDLITDTLFPTEDQCVIDQMIKSKKIVRTGWPMEYTQGVIESKKPAGNKKRDLILFPHRVAPEKQPEIFKDLAKTLGHKYKFIVCQDQQLTKDEYHKLLHEAKIVFSANLQETLGISAYEGAIAGAFPLMPERLSYCEMYPEVFKYDSRWTESWDSYLVHKDALVQLIENIMCTHQDLGRAISDLSQSLRTEFFSADILVQTIVGDHTNG